MANRVIKVDPGIASAVQGIGVKQQELQQAMLAEGAKIKAIAELVIAADGGGYTINEQNPPRFEIPQGGSDMVLILPDLDPKPETKKGG